MSKMFDALRRAEEERRKRAAGRGSVSEAGSAVVDVTRQSLATAVIPEGLFRELGLLKNSLDANLRGKGKKSLLFTSSTRQEGTTTLSVSFAKLLALQGERVLLCEVNARNPVYHEVFSLDNKQGVADCFSGEVSLGAMAQESGLPGLSVIPAGQTDAAKIQLYLRNFFPRIIEAALAEYATVIFDAPPVTVSPETPPMSAYVDGVILVVQAGKTKREVVKRSIQALAQFDGKILGVVLNRKRYYIPEFLYKRV